MAMTLVGLFLITSLPERLTNKGPMLWPVMGIVPSLILRTNDVYGWITEALIKSGCTFHFRGMWRGPLGIIAADPSKIEYMLKSKELPKRKLLQRKTSDLLGEGIFNADDDMWKQQRRAAISELHSGHFVAYSRQTVEDLVHP